MPNTKRVIFAFATLRKAAETFVLAIRHEVISSACQYLMAVCLMANIPHHLIIGSIINIVQCCRKLNNTQTSAKMTAVNTHNINDVLAQFVADLVKLVP